MGSVMSPRPVLAALLLAAWPGLSQEDPWDTKFMVGNDRNLQIHCAWSARERAGGPYAEGTWPQGALATERALLFAARQVLRDEWKIGAVVAAEHPGGGHVQLAEAETNFYKKHTDHPPHIHINFIWPKWSGHVNTHFLTTEDGKVSKPWIIWWVPGCEGGERNPPAGRWWPELDQHCRPVWWQTWTEDGAIQLKRTQEAPIYTLRARNISGDLGGADVHLGDRHIYWVDITEYDPLRLRMVVRIGDLRARKLITETFTGDPATHRTLTRHSTEETPLEDTPMAPAQEPPPHPATDPRYKTPPSN
ncbi:MAG: hypothetical protein MUC88_06320 [Planctomycetes bacterium]|jgi:hypothetical protein|nr:hypothetical protein [Planctomycetota bacterium]